MLEGRTLVTAALLLGAAAARADEGIPITAGTDAGPRHRISLQLGLGAPLGAAGLGWAYAPAKSWRIETGAGIGFTGPQLSLMPGLSVGSGRSRFVAGAGPAISWDLGHPGLWLNVEAAGYERVFANGFSFFMGGGVTMPFQQSKAGSGKAGVTFPAFVPVPLLRIGIGSWVGGAVPTAGGAPASMGSPASSGWRRP